MQNSHSLNAKRSLTPVTLLIALAVLLIALCLLFGLALLIFNTVLQPSVNVWPVQNLHFGPVSNVTVVGVVLTLTPNQLLLWIFGCWTVFLVLLICGGVIGYRRYKRKT